MARAVGMDKRRHVAPPKEKLIISVIQQKGGAGKTTLAVHLAHMIADLRPQWRVMIADADPQGSALNWISRGLEKGDQAVTATPIARDGDGKGLRRELEALEADVVIIDLPPAIEAISLRAALYADIMLVPVGASPLDIEAAGAAVSVCQEAMSIDPRKTMILVPSRIRSGTASARELRPVLERWGTVSQASLSLRVAYSDAALSGEGIHSYAPASDAYREMAHLAREVFTHIESRQEENARQAL